jgi:starch synthase
MIGYDEILAHLIQAGSDALIVPSRFEPCGLTQLCALRYGAVPIVSRVGGLEDTIVATGEAETSDREATGFKFGPVTADALAGSLRKANAAFRNKAAWRRLQLSGLATDVSWGNRAGDYAALYRDLMTSRPA